MGDIFREVDEELRQERYTRLWRRHGKHAIGAVVLLVAAVAAWKGWESHQTSERHAEGLRYEAADRLARDGKASEAEAAFAALAGETSSGYGVLARFRRAALMAEGGDREGAIAVYDGLAADGAAPDSLRGVATVLAGLQALALPSGSADAVESRVGPLAAAGGAYRHTALELLALSAHRSGDVGKALEHYRTIVDDAEAPPGIRARAAQMARILDPSPREPGS